ncbi:MAG TPA: PIG-L family deacetylase [Verrucomicrobiae bacterium]|nr:PIG-L family deacetylase [Verrucomicrobiae bacterium]
MSAHRRTRTAVAIAAHPDDIEFFMAGTLLLLKQAAWEIHYLTVANGSCGSVRYNPAQTRAIRRKESITAAGLLGARYHNSLTNDLEIFYELTTLRRLAALIREVKPSIVLTHSPQDYMEDHTNTSRLAVTAAFARGMANFRTHPPRPAISSEVTVYHAMPHGLRDGLRRRIVPELYVNTAAVHSVKREALACHRSQKDWLDVSQGLDSYLKTMDTMSLAVGRMSGRFKHAEGWRRHLHLGFCEEQTDPLRETLRQYCVLNQRYKRDLERY